MLLDRKHEYWMDLALREAMLSAQRKEIPVGAVIVQDGMVIGRGSNQTETLQDPTAHAEIVAIREACMNIGSFDLSGATLYSTCEPCPMCLSAVYWANIRNLYFCSTRYQAEEIGFKDNHIYNELNREIEERSIPTQQLDHPMAKELFKEWIGKADKISY